MARRRRKSKGPNGLEKKVASLAPKASFLRFTGNGKFWIDLPLLQKRKNPDFILPGPDPARPLEGVVKVIEAFGDYYHSEKFTGLSKQDHEKLLIAAYAGVGIRCLVLWESQVNENPRAVRQRIRRFLKS
jgi:hypothetical protein